MPVNIAIYEAEEGGSVVAAVEPGILGRLGVPLLEQMEEMLDGVISRLFERVSS